MTHRTTFALDRTTADRIDRLATRWKVSKAEVVRRAVANADQKDVPTAEAYLQALRTMQAEGRGLVREKAETYIAEVREDRRNWRGT